MRALFFVISLLCAPAGFGAERLSVCIFFDPAADASALPVGERSALMLRNLLGHFREVEARQSPLAAYSPGDLARCDRAAYIGTRFDHALPPAFLAELPRYGKPFLWINYNIWKLQEALGRERFAAAWGFVYQRIDPGTQAKPGQVPSFYSDFAYKGARFRKVAELHPARGFVGHPETVIVRRATGEVLAEAIRPADGARTPYVTRKGANFFIADNPTAVIDQRDRYLIFADVLFDFLGLAPRNAKRYALVRIEDVHPRYDVRLLNQTMEVLHARKVPYAISLIPRYVGPRAPRGFNATDSRRFLSTIRHGMDNGASILVHGYEHDLPGYQDCSDGSGEGYEFWDGCKDLPLTFESVEWVQGRLDKAKKILRDAKITHVGWVTPHYMASPLGFRVIQQNFGRIMQRMPYFLEGRPMDGPNTIEQYYPYTIYRDHFGAHIWPENLGYVPLPERGGETRHVEAILEAARANKVLRDVWASFFWHPPLIHTDLGIVSLERLVDGIRAEGYEFVSLRALRERGE